MLNRSRNAIFPIVAMIVAVTTVCLGSSSSNQHSGGVADAQSLHTYRAFARSPAQVADSNDPWDAVTKLCQNVRFGCSTAFQRSNHKEWMFLSYEEQPRRAVTDIDGDQRLNVCARGDDGKAPRETRRPATERRR